MNRLIVRLLLGLLVLSSLPPVSTHAQVSRSAVLFLRIPQGARAIAMGRSFTAIAEDASATFWNPAGLGAAPMAEQWQSIEVPLQFRPLSDVISRQENPNSATGQFELWAIGNNRLVRFRDGKWSDREVIVTRTSDQFDQLIAKYVSADDADTRQFLANRILAVNNHISHDELTAITDSLKGALRAGTVATSLAGWVDSLDLFWTSCRLNLTGLENLRHEYGGMIADGSLNEAEQKRLAVILSSCRNSFIPEELSVPFSAITGDSITNIAASSRTVLVSSQTGLLSYIGNGWRVVSGDAAGILPKGTAIHKIAVAGTSFFVATERGLLTLNGADIDTTASKKGLPAGEVAFVGGSSATNMFAVVNNDIYRYDGMIWTNTAPFLVPIDATPEKIARRFAPYGTAADQQDYLAKLQATGGSAQSDSVAAAQPGKNTSGLKLTAGAVVEVPLLSHLRGNVYGVSEAYGSIFVATEYGLLRRNDDGWRLLGYDSVAFNAPLDSIARLADGVDGETAEGYQNRIMAINDLTAGSTPDGRGLWIPSRAAAGPVTRIQRVEGTLIFSTSKGAFKYDGVNFTRANMDELHGSELLTAVPAGRDIWYTSRDEAVTTQPGTSDLTVSYVKWLPNLASDLYFLPISAAFSLGNAGTLGVNLTGISYGSIERTNEQGVSLGQFNSYDASLTVSYGIAVSRPVKLGMSFKVIESRLSQQGAGQEKGSGDAFGIAFDLGTLWEPSDKLSLGATIANIGPKMAYIDAAQSDPLPANFSLGIAGYPWKAAKSHFMVTGETDMQLVGQSAGDMVKNATLKAGAEFLYEDLFALRGGYYHDKLGKVSNLTVGVGLRPIKQFSVDVAYVIDDQDAPLAGTLPITLNVRL